MKTSKAKVKLKKKTVELFEILRFNSINTKKKKKKKKKKPTQNAPVIKYWKYSKCLFSMEKYHE